MGGVVNPPGGSVSITTTADDDALLGKGDAPEDWGERRAEYIASYLDAVVSHVTQELGEGWEVTARVGDVTYVSVEGGEVDLQHDLWEEIDDHFAALDLVNERVHLAMSQAWVAWSEDL